MRRRPTTRRTGGVACLVTYPGHVSWSTEPYPSELSDREWALVEPELPAAKPGGRPRRVDLRRILTGLFDVLRSGCQWRMLPRRFGPWSTVYAYFRSWRLAGVWDQLQTTLREQVRRLSSRLPTPSAAILDTQSVKTTERGGPHGNDGAKQLSGRKRHLLVDTLGLALGALVHPADMQDRVSAPWLLRRLQPTRPRLELIWADSAYLGPRCSRRSRRRSAGGCRSSNGPAVDGGFGCARTRSRPHGCRASTPPRTAGLLNGRLRGSAATGDYLGSWGGRAARLREIR